MESPQPHTPAELHSALFANLVMQQGNLALMFLGKMPNPETGETVRELETARMFIDVLEMLEAKTRGNVNADEKALLGQTLMTLRMAYVEEVRASRPPDQTDSETKPAAASPSAPAEAKAAAEEDKKKFVKKY